MPKRNTSLTRPTYDHILNLIMTKQLMPGDHIPELKISEEFGISRTPVRDALKQLANDGLVDIYPNRFVKVSEYDSKAILDIAISRIALEKMVVKLASLYGSQADFLRLKSIALLCHDALASSDILGRLKHDCDFHSELAMLSRNDLIIKYQKELYLRVKFIILHEPNLVKEEKTQLDHHLELVDALMNHDDAKAQSIVVKHLSSFYKLKDQFPLDFFN